MLTDKQRQILSVLSATVHSGGDGATASTTDTEPTEGVMVGGVVPELVITDTATATQQIQEFITCNSGEFYGVWQDRATGYYHVDISEHYPAPAQGVAVARARGELAVWDLARGEEIRTN